MRLPEALIPQYLEFLSPAAPAEQRQAQVESWRRQVQAGERQLENEFAAVSAGGKVTAAAYIEAAEPGTYYIGLPRRVLLDETIKASDVAMLIRDAILRLRELRARAGEFRLVERPHLLPLGSTLAELGFQRRHDRIEFQTSLDDLPDETGTPLMWEAVSEDGPLRLAEAARLFEAASVGDPESEPDQDGLKALQVFLGDPEFRSGLDSIQIGLLEGKPCAFIMAQVIRSSGWSRITHMGVLPEFRGRGLGKWVQRRGFVMMRAQGGTLYHGGTTRTNVAMEAVFRGHGCREFCAMQQWKICL
jgi:GNAT superfamily N-acetyltransferase